LRGLLRAARLRGRAGRPAQGRRLSTVRPARRGRHRDTRGAALPGRAPAPRAALLLRRGQPGLRGRLLVGAPGRRLVRAVAGAGGSAPGRAGQHPRHLPGPAGGAGAGRRRGVSALVLAALLAAVDTLVVGTLADPVSLDPHRATDLVSAAVLTNVCEPLVRYRADGTRAEGVLATGWATVDARTWTFTLRPSVRFHDGAPLD